MNDEPTTTTKTGKRRENGAGTISKTAHGYIGAISLRDPRTGATGRRWVRGKSTAIVRDKMDQLIQNSRTGKALTSNRRTVEEFLLQWLEVHVRPNRKPLTYRGYESHVRLYLIPLLGKMQLDQLSGLDVQRCLNAASDKGVSPTTVKSVNATLKSALSTARRWGVDYVENNAAKNASPPKQITFRPKPLLAPQGIQLLNVAVNHRFEALFYCGLLEGMRSGEICALQWSNVDFEQGIIKVRDSLQRIVGKGAVLTGDVKSEDSDREIPLLPVVAAALRRRKARQER
jgi:integrase